MAEIGILGGTFDPIHNGHLMLGKQAYREYHLDQVWFMPSGTPPHKKDHAITSAEDRCAMVRLAIRPYPDFICSEFEIRREGNTYTAQTLRLLKEAYPQHRFYFIVGADSLYQMENWYHPEQVLGQVILLVAEREYEGKHRPIEEQIAYLSEKYNADIRLLHSREMDVSSEELREREAEGEDIDSFVPAAVEAYIQAHGLYQEEDR